MHQIVNSPIHHSDCYFLPNYHNPVFNPNERRSSKSWYQTKHVNKNNHKIKSLNNIQKWEEASANMSATSSSI